MNTLPAAVLAAVSDSEEGPVPAIEFDHVTFRYAASGEDALSDVQQTIERYERTLKDWDKRVQYASVSVSLEEKRSVDAVREGDMGLTARMRSALMESVEWLAEFAQGVLVFIVAALPVAGAAGVAALAGWLIHKGMIKCTRGKKKE